MDGNIWRKPLLQVNFSQRLLNPDVHFYPDIDWDFIAEDIKSIIRLSNSRKVRYYEIPVAFDIETTSFQSTGNEKLATMYAWGLSINGHVILGRQWHEFEDVYNDLVSMFKPTEKERLLIYIQNLSYEFQFMCKRFKWKKVFALKERKPIYAITEENVEFRCSYMLSSYSLEKMGENLQKYKIKKLVGDLDYSLIRHYNTPLSEKEWKYLINDVQVVVAYIQEAAENDGGYHKIPLTNTGYVRNYCRKICFQDKYYRLLMKSLILDFDEYKQLKRAFQGGYTHANWHTSKQIVENMDCFDFTSSYPYVMVSEKFPMSQSKLVEPQNMEEMLDYLSKYCCLFDVEFNKIDGWHSPDHIISLSKCRKVEGEITNNGRIIYADRIQTTITEVDWESIVRFYKWEDMKISNFRIYKKQYLPHQFVKAILKLYKDKTELKGVDGKEVEYMRSKGMVNSAYGMCVTDIIRDEETFDDEWVKNKADGLDAIERYNSNKNRFLFYPWGIWVTAYARRNLFTGIYEFQEDYIYSDTDSIKGINSHKHMDYINKYNSIVKMKLEKACEYHKIPIEDTKPKTIKGIEKPLGVWDFDGHYDRFKTLGAKRYMTEANGEISITVAGLAKTHAVPYMKKLSRIKNMDIFDIFDEDLYIPGEHTGKSIHTYNDVEFSSQLEDYLGNIAIVHEYSSIHLAPAEYSLSIDSNYLNLLKGVYFIDG